MLACALLGTQRAKAAYAEAIRRGFRLFSYGDAMLIL
jgi:S-adenosylmethionine:tRNA ribosyltransferase-isomerase